MTITAIDSCPALVVIDLQKGIVGLETAHPAAEVVARAAQLAAAFRRHGYPVVLVNVKGGARGRTDGGPLRPAGQTRPPDWDELVPELDAQPSDLKVTKHTWGAFHETPLQELLTERGVTQVVLAGIATTFGVESTARNAHELGYNVVLASDAMTDRSAQSHQNSLELVFPRLGEVATTEEIIALLDKS